MYCFRIQYRAISRVSTLIIHFPRIINLLKCVISFHFNFPHCCLFYYLNSSFPKKYALQLLIQLQTSLFLAGSSSLLTDCCRPKALYSSRTMWGSILKCSTATSSSLLVLWRLLERLPPPPPNWCNSSPFPYEFLYPVITCFYNLAPLFSIIIMSLFSPVFSPQSFRIGSKISWRNMIWRNF